MARRRSPFGPGLRRPSLADLPARYQEEVRLRAATAAAQPARTHTTAESPCPVCEGAGFFKEAVPYWHPSFGQLVPCVCRTGEREQAARAALFTRSGLGAFRDKTFATFNPDIPGVRQALLRARQYAANPQGWQVFLGECGVGKTHLAAAIGHEIFERRTPQVIMAVVPDLLDHLRSTFGPSSEQDYDETFAAYCEVEVLILDDFGTQNTTAWACEKLYQIINHRYNEALATVITTNHRPGEIDRRSWSRMSDRALCLGGPVEIRAGDYRSLTLEQRYPAEPARPRAGQRGAA